MSAAYHDTTSPDPLLAARIPRELLQRDLQARYRQATEIEHLITALVADLAELRQSIAALERGVCVEGQQ